MKENIKKKKVVGIVIVSVVLSLLFLICAIPGISSKVNQNIMGNRIIAYLENEYNLTFEIEEFKGMTYAKEGVIEGCPGGGSNCYDGWDDKERPYYNFEIYSTSDNVYFDAYLFDDNGEIMYKDNYKVIKDYNSTVDKVISYIKEQFGNQRIEKDEPRENYYFRGNKIEVYIDEKLDELLLDSKYIAQLYEMSESINILMFEGFSDIDVAEGMAVNVNYTDDRIVVMQGSEIGKSTVGVWVISDYGRGFEKLNEYLEDMNE